MTSHLSLMSDSFGLLTSCHSQGRIRQNFAILIRRARGSALKKQSIAISGRIRAESRSPAKFKIPRHMLCKPCRSILYYVIDKLSHLPSGAQCAFCQVCEQLLLSLDHHGLYLSVIPFMNVYTSLTLINSSHQ